MIQAINECLV